MVMPVVRHDRLGLGIAEHQRLDRLAEGIFLERQMRGEEAGEPRKDERLHGEHVVTLLLLCGLAVAHRARQRVGEQLVHIGMQMIGGRFGAAVGREQAPRMDQIARVELFFESARAVFLEVTTHGEILNSPDKSETFSRSGRRRRAALQAQ